jgi:hypothetical protein
MTAMAISMVATGRCASTADNSTRKSSQRIDEIVKQLTATRERSADAFFSCNLAVRQQTFGSIMQRSPADDGSV